MARLMARMLEGSKSTISFVDDLFTCSSLEKGWEGHLNDIRDLFRRVKEANINPKKTVGVSDTPRVVYRPPFQARSR